MFSKLKLKLLKQICTLQRIVGRVISRLGGFDILAHSRLRLSTVANSGERVDSTVLPAIVSFFAFSAVILAPILTPVISYTRVSVRALRMHGARAARCCATLRTAVILVLALSICGIGISIFGSATVTAATANTVNFQARLQSGAGSIAPDGNYNVQFNLYNALTGGTALWTESRTYISAGNDNRVRVANGYLTVNLGSVTAFPAINWSQDLYLTMNIGGTTTTASYDGEMNPRLKLTAVPYAFSAGQLSTTNGANSTTLTFTPPTSTNSILLPDASGVVCLASSSACGFASSAGSGAYIQNGTALQTTANFNIQSTNASSVTGTLRAITGQTADLLQFRNASGTAPLSGFNASGQLYYQSGSFTGTLVQATLGQNTTYTLPDPGASGTATICLTTGNCAGTGGGITGTGNTNYIARFNSASTLNASTLLYDNGSFVGVNTTTNSGVLSVSSTNASQSGAFVSGVASATVPVVVVRSGATPGVGADLINFQDSTGTTVAKIASNGSISGNNQILAGTLTVSGTGASSVAGQLNITATAPLGLSVSTGGQFGGGLSVLGANGIGLGVAGSVAGKISFANTTNANVSVLQSNAPVGAGNATYVLPSVNSNTSDQICLQTLANCTGTGGGIAGSGTQYYLAKFNSLGGNSIGNSSIYDDGTFVGVNTSTNAGLISAVGAAASQSTLFIQGASNATVPVEIIKGGSSPAANADLLQLQNISGTVLAKIDKAGNFTAQTGTLTGLSVSGASNLAGTVTATGSISQTGTGTLSTGTGAISLNGATSVTGTNTLNVGTGATILGGTLNVAGLTTLTNGLTVSNGLTVAGVTSLTGNTNINTTGPANTAIGNATGSFSLLSSGLNIATTGAVSGVSTLVASGAITAATTGNTINGLIVNGGALSGVTGYAQSSGNFAISGTGTLTTGTGAISLNGATSVTGTNSFSIGTGAVTFGSLGAGLVQSSAAGLLTSGAVDRNNSAFFSGSLSAANGGTGASSFTANGVLFGNGTAAIQASAAGTSGQILQSNASGVPTFTTLSGDIAISATGVTSVNSLQGNTLTITTPTTGQFVRYNGTGFVNASIQASDVPDLGATYIKNGTVSQTGNFNVTGNGIIGGTATIATLGVTGNATVAGTLAVTGTTTLTGLLTANGGVTTTNGSFTGNVSQTGTGTFSTGTGAINLNGNVTIASGSTLSAVGTVGTISTTTSGNNLNFSRGAANYITATNAAGALYLGVAANVTAFSIDIAGQSNFSGNVILAAGKTLTVGTGATTLGGTLTTTGLATLNGGATVNGTTAVTGATTINTTGTATTTIGNASSSTIVGGTITVQGTGSSSITGNLGIGVAAPTQKLQVAGNIRLDQVAAPTAPTAAINATAGTLTGAYSYRVSYV
ncbi:hypothetical protein H7171_03395, partial [Candidatus Saccharibacteria bacterium]|nr:hypothetical protein [Candidatus Saccharibacteria bacterium]